MEFVAYNYFKTPLEAELASIAEIVDSSFQISHAGKNDPPGIFNGKKENIYKIISEGTEATNYTFLKDVANGLEMSIEIHNDPRWEYSTISISGRSKESVEDICTNLNQAIESFMCISGVLDLGASQAWSILHQSRNCPLGLLEKIKNA